MPKTVVMTINPEYGAYGMRESYEVDDAKTPVAFCLDKYRAAKIMRSLRSLQEAQQCIYLILVGSLFNASADTYLKLDQTALTALAERLGEVEHIGRVLRKYKDSFWFGRLPLKAKEVSHA